MSSGKNSLRSQLNWLHPKLSEGLSLGSNVSPHISIQMTKLFHMERVNLFHLLGPYVQIFWWSHQYWPSLFYSLTWLNTFPCLNFPLSPLTSFLLKIIITNSHFSLWLWFSSIILRLKWIDIRMYFSGSHTLTLLFS